MEPHDLPEVAYLLTILISLSITCAIGVYAFRQRKVVGAMAFAVTIFLEAAWIMGYLAGTINITLQGKIFWDNIQWIPILFLPLAILSFAREYGGTRFKHPVRVWTILSIIPIGTLVAVFTNPWHGLAESSMRLSFGGIFPEFVYDFGPLLWAGVVYALAVTYVGVMTLIRLALRQQGIFRSQILFIVLGFVIPTVGTLIGMMALVIGYDHNLDLSPFTFTIANILVAYGLFRYRLFEVVPFAREQVMEKMVDGVIILDAFGRVLDVNGAFQKMVGQPDRRWGGQPLISMLPDWFDQADLNPAVPSGHKEITLRQNQLTRYIDVEITWLLNPRGQFSGHMIILRDITAHKTQENALKEGQSILEQLVSERTAELHAANEFFKAEAEQRRRAELEKEAQRSEMEILYKLTVELAELPVDADLEHIIVARLKQLTGANIVALTEYNPDKKQLEMRGLETDSVILREANRIFGRNFLELVVPVDEAGYAMLVKSSVLYVNNLNEATLGVVPSAASALIARLFNLELFIGMVAQYQGEIMGTFILVMHPGQARPTEWLLTALANVLSIIYRRKRAERARIESESRFQNLAEMLPQPIYECDLSGKITYTNRIGLEIFGYPGGGTELNQSIFDLIAAGAQQEVAQANMRRIIQGQAVAPSEYLARRKDGSTFPVLMYSGPIIQNAQIKGMRGAVVDITERKAVEEALRVSEEKFRSIIEQSSEGVMLVDEGGQVLELNQAFEVIYGMPKAEILGKSFWEMTSQFVYPGQQGEDVAQEAREDFKFIVTDNPDNLTYMKESEFIAPDGRLRVILRMAFPIVVSQGRRMAVMVRDITEQKQAERKLVRLNRSLRTASNCNLALVRAMSEVELIQSFCDEISLAGEYPLVWVDRIDETGLAFRQDAPIVGATLDATGLDIRDLLPGTHFEANGRDLVDNQQAVWLNQLSAPENPADLESLIQGVAQTGAQGLTLLPLGLNGERYGLLIIATAKKDRFDADERALLNELAADLSFGIHTLRVRTDRTRNQLLLEQSNEELAAAYDATLVGWSRALELREQETAGHSNRVVEISVQLSRRLHIPEQEIVHVRRGALLHDIGKMGVPDAILLKKGPLDAEEWAIMRQHTLYAEKMLSGIDHLAPALDIPLCHHENWDGQGYPHGLRGEEIPLTARIFAIVDVWDALTSTRSYRTGWPVEKVRAYLAEKSGSQFDPRVVQAFFEYLDATLR